MKKIPYKDLILRDFDVKYENGESSISDSESKNCQSATFTEEQIEEIESDFQITPLASQIGYASPKKQLQT